jgi:peptide/nickel transport system ATP-binding protein
MQELLQVEGLTINYRSFLNLETPAAIGVTFAVRTGETLGLLGESGCGKTSTALALMRLLPRSARIARGRVFFRGQSILDLPERDLERMRGAQIAMIFQEPSIALNPIMRVGDQVAEVIRAHRSWNSRHCRAAALDVLSRVRLAETAGAYDAFPHELSGGQRQRILIALALACEPALVIADEPTTGLDAGTQSEILQLLVGLKQRLRTSFLFISHHPGVLAQMADRIAVMYAGKIVEEGSRNQVLQNPLHPFTRGLMQSMPQIPRESVEAREKPLSQIAGNPPDMNCLPGGCSFAPRCPERRDACATLEPEMIPLADNRYVRCFLYGE